MRGHGGALGICGVRSVCFPSPDAIGTYRTHWGLQPFWRLWPGLQACVRPDGTYPCTYPPGRCIGTCVEREKPRTYPCTYVGLPMDVVAGHLTVCARGHLFVCLGRLSRGQNDNVSISSVAKLLFGQFSIFLFAPSRASPQRGIVQFVCIAERGPGIDHL